MEILKARVGFCVGILRAYRLMNRRAARDAPFHATHRDTRGEFDTLRRVERREGELLKRYPGLAKVSVLHDLSGLGEGDRLVVGFQGLPRSAKARLAEKGVALLDDFECPFITRLNRALERLAAEGFDIVIVGKRENHHCREAQRLAEEHGRRCFIVEKLQDLEAVAPEPGRKLALVGQVTGNTVTFEEAAGRLRERGLLVEVVRTICSDSYLRQGAAMDLAAEADAVVLVDDGGGAAESVFEVCARLGRQVHRIRSTEELQREWFEGLQRVAVLGGILVPEWSLDEVTAHIEGLCAAAGGGATSPPPPP